MDELRDCKRDVYDQIPIPGGLPYATRSAVARSRGKRRRFLALRLSVSAAVCVCALFIAAFNTSPALAEALQSVPVLGEVARVFTFRSYSHADPAKYVNVRIPAISNTGNTELETLIYGEIRDKIDLIVAEAEQRAGEFRQAFLDTGGQEEDFIPYDIMVDYKVYYTGHDRLSFVISEVETHASYYAETYFYNIDLATGRALTLADLLGPDYEALVNRSIYEQIAQRTKAGGVYFADGEGAFSGIAPDQAFYINQAGNPVIVFNKYEIAPGCMGTQEFEIKPGA